MYSSFIDRLKAYRNFDSQSEDGPCVVIYKRENPNIRTAILFTTDRPQSSGINEVRLLFSVQASEYIIVANKLTDEARKALKQEHLKAKNRRPVAIFDHEDTRFDPETSVYGSQVHMSDFQLCGRSLPKLLQTDIIARMRGIRSGCVVFHRSTLIPQTLTDSEMFVRDVK